MIMVSKRKHPKFLRPNYGRSSRSRIKLAWRRPRGIDNKKRSKIKYMGCSPSIGYGQPCEIKYNHPLGLPEALVQTPSEVKSLKGVVVRIAGGVGRVKREEIIKLCEAAKIKVVNKTKKYALKIKKKFEAKKADAKKADAKKADEKASEPKPGAAAEVKTGAKDFKTQAKE